MSATVGEVFFYEATCSDCNVWSEPFPEEVDAVEWAAIHDAEQHETDNSDDDAYEKFKEARK